MCYGRYNAVLGFRMAPFCALFFHVVKCISGICSTPVVGSWDVICMRLLLRLMMVTILVLPLPVGVAVPTHHFKDGRQTT